jgi:hypothetical protein
MRQPGLFILVLSLASGAPAAEKGLWSLKPVSRPPVPKGYPQVNPIDAFLRRAQTAKGLHPLPLADKATLLRRVYLDLTGLPPSPADVHAFLDDSAPDAYEKVVDRLLASEHHGERYARHWLDVLRYADVDGGMPSNAGLFHWRDWIISALNRDVPYDRFVRAQIVGDTSDNADDFFATGLLARGAQSLEDKEQELAFGAVETISSAFMGMTVGCARCHDHRFDPILNRDYYGMKALFDPLVLDKRVLATAEQIVDHARAVEEYKAKRAVLEAPLIELEAPYRKKLLDERILMLPPDVQAAIRKPEAERNQAERKIYDDYAPIIRIDPPKVIEVMPPELRERRKELDDRVRALKAPPDLPVFWTVREDPKRSEAKSYILVTGDPEKKTDAVAPGFPFAPPNTDFTRGRRQTFVDWLTAPDNPLFARVAVNRMWQWHFGEGIVPTLSDFGNAGEVPSMPELLDWLASEFVAHKFSMKAIHRLIVTSEAYRTASTGPAKLIAANAKIDPGNRFLTRFGLRRLEAEVVRDLAYSVSGQLDLTVGGRSFREGPPQYWTGGDTVIGDYDTRTNRRTLYMGRGFHGDVELLPAFLQNFDAEDGRRACPRRNRTVTAPQALAMMNSPAMVEQADRFAERLLKECDGNLPHAVELGYMTALSRRPTSKESDIALTYVENDPRRMAGFTWMLLNLDEFIYLQ